MVRKAVGEGKKKGEERGVRHMIAFWSISQN